MKKIIQLKTRSIETETINPFQTGLLIDLKISRWGGQSKVSKENLKNLPEEVRAAQKLLSDSSLLDEVHEKARQADNWLRRVTLPSPYTGCLFVKMDTIEDIDKKLIEFQSEYMELAKRFSEKFEDQISFTEKSLKKRGYGNFFDRNKYPRNILSHFGFKWTFREIVVPGKKLEEISPDLYQKEMKKVQGEVIEFQEAVFARAKTIIMDRIKAILSACTGEAKAPGKSVNAMERKLDEWDLMYGEYIGSQQFKKIISDIKSEMKGMSGDKIRDDESYKEDVAEKFSVISKKLEKLDFEKPKRALRF